MSEHARPESIIGAAHLVPMRTHRSGRSAVLLDLENLLFDQERVAAFPVAVGDDGVVHSMPLDPWVDNDSVQALLSAARRDAVAALGGPADYWLAAATSDLVRQVFDLPAMDGIASRVIASGPNSVDEYLLDIAEHLSCVGFTNFVIVSGDHAFTDFVSRHAATVIARNHRSLARDLRMAASRVHLLDAELA